jgi:CheY-like chemotaxis protein
MPPRGLSRQARRANTGRRVRCHSAAVGDPVLAELERLSASDGTDGGLSPWGAAHRTFERTDLPTRRTLIESPLVNLAPKLLINFQTTKTSSDWGQGGGNMCTFRFAPDDELSLGDRPSEDGSTIQDPSPKKSGRPLVAKAVGLVVDDERYSRTVMRRALESGGYRCIEAGSAEEALTVVDQVQIDFIVLDLQMPGMGGLGMIRELQKKENLLLSRLIIVSGSPGDLNGTKWSETFRPLVLQKPYRIAALLEAIEGLLPGKKS